MKGFPSSLTTFCQNWIEVLTEETQMDYNGVGQRVSQEASSVITEYLLDTQPGLAKVIASKTGGNTTRFVHDPMGIHSQENPNGDWLHMVKDGLGSVRQVFDDNLSELYTAEYAPYGEVWNSSGAEQTPFAFTGEMLDDNGLQYHRARYLDPNLGVWMSLDPLETANRYGYVNGNPVNVVDMSGMRGELPYTCNPSPNQEPGSPVQSPRFPGLPVFVTEQFALYDTGIRYAHDTAFSYGGSYGLGQIRITDFGGHSTLPSHLQQGGLIDIYMPQVSDANSVRIVPDQNGWKTIWRSNALPVNFNGFGNNEDFLEQAIGSSGIWVPGMMTDSWMLAEITTNPGACANFWNEADSVTQAYNAINSTTAFGSESDFIYAGIPEISSTVPDTSGSPITNRNPIRETFGNPTSSNQIRQIPVSLFVLGFDVIAYLAHNMQRREAFVGNWGNFDGVVFAQVQEKTDNATNAQYRATIHSLQFATRITETFTSNEFVHSYMSANGFVGFSSTPSFIKDGYGGSWGGEWEGNRDVVCLWD